MSVVSSYFARRNKSQSDNRRVQYVRSINVIDLSWSRRRLIVPPHLSRDFEPPFCYVERYDNSLSVSDSTFWETSGARFRQRQRRISLILSIEQFGRFVLFFFNSFLILNAEYTCFKIPRNVFFDSTDRDWSRRRERLNRARRRSEIFGLSCIPSNVYTCLTPGDRHTSDDSVR